MPPKSVKKKEDQGVSSRAVTKGSPQNGSNTVIAKARTESTTGSTIKKKVNTEGVSQSTASTGTSEASNPLFSRSSSIDVKDGVSKSTQASKAASRNHTQAGTSKPPRQRQKPISTKLVEMTKQLQTKLDKDEGVVVDCTYLADNGKAVIDEPSQEWVHILKLRSELPFCLIKQTVLQSGPYTGHIAVVIRQETPFRILSLPLHIRTRIYNFAIKHDQPTIPIAMRGSSRTVWSPTYHSPNALALLRTCKQIHTEAAPLIYTQPFTFPGTQVASDFLIKISRNRALVRILRCETYASQSARTMFHLLSDARNLLKLNFAHVSSNETPKKAVMNIWNDAGVWLAEMEKGNPIKGLEVLEFGEQAFHMREKDKKVGGYKITCWGTGEQLEFLKGLRAKMVAEGKRLQKAG